MDERMAMERTRGVFQLLLMLAGLVTALAPARADDFYKGKTFTIVVGFSPGGGYDVNARGLARHLVAHIPVNPNIICQHMPYAGSLTTVLYITMTAPKGILAMPIYHHV